MLHDIPAAPSAASPGAQSTTLFARGRVVFPDGTTRATVERDPTRRDVLRGEGAYLVDVMDSVFWTLITTSLLSSMGTVFPRRLMLWRTAPAFPIRRAELLVDRIPAVKQIPSSTPEPRP